METKETREELIFAGALSRQAPAERTAYLDQACAGDAELRERVEALLRAHSKAGAFLNPPSVETSAASDEAPGTETPGTVIGRYKLLEKIGAGGFGDVWMAEQAEPVQRRVALKILKPGMDTREVVARFEAERQALALMDHPSIAKVLDGGATVSGRPYFVMELVRGIRITDYCEQNNLPTIERLNLFTQVCHAVQHAHQKGIIHRDLKPSNILVTVNDGKPAPKVIDFGIAKATEQRLTEKTLFTRFAQFLGTPAYMSPEQAAMTSLDIDTRSDIYSLGVLLYELLTGRTPFDTKELLEAGLDEMRRIIREKEPPTPSTRLTQERLAMRSVSPAKSAIRNPQSTIDKDLDWIVMKCLEKDRTRRYETANGLASDLQRHLNNEPVAAGPPSRVYRLKKFVRKHRLGVTAAAAIVLLLTAATAVSTGLALWANREKGRAGRAEEEANSHLTRLQVANGNRLVEEGNLVESLLWFADALKRIKGNPPREEIHRIRLNSVLSQCPRVIHVFTHKENVRWCEFGAGGKRLATASDDGTARVWDALTGRPVSPPLRHPRAVLSAVFSPDGTRLVTASADGSARVWDAVTGKRLLPLRHSNVVYSAFFNSDGRHIVTASADKTAQVWDALTGETIGSPLRHSDIVYFASFSPDGKKVVTASKDGTARVWDAISGSPLTGSIRAGGPVYMATFSPDGERIVTACDNRNETDGSGTRIWNAVTGEPLSPPLDQKQDVNYARFSPDGLHLLTGSGSAAKLWNGGAELPLRSELNYGNRHGVFSADGSRVAGGGDHRKAMVWDVDTGEPLTPPLPHAGWVQHVAFSPDGRWLATASDDGTTKLWDLVMDRSPALQLREAGPVRDLNFSPDGGRVVTGTAVNPGRAKAHLWDANSGEELPSQMEDTAAINQVKFSPDGARILTAGGRVFYDEFPPTNVCIWNSTNSELSVKIGHADHVRYATFSPDGRSFVTTTRSGEVRVWETQSGRPISLLLRHESDVRQAAFSPDGHRVITVEDDKAQVWDINTGQPVFEPLEHLMTIHFADFSPDGRQILTTSHDQHFRLWDALTGKPLTPPIKHAGTVAGGAFSPDSRRVITFGPSHSAKLWNAETGTRALPPLRHQASVLFAQFSPDGRLIATTSKDHSARLWDAATGEAVTVPLKHGARVSIARFSPDQRRLATASDDHMARLWTFRPIDMPAEDLELLAQVQSSQQMDSTLSLVGLNGDAVRSALDTLRNRYPHEFARTPEQLVSWHRAQAGEAEAAGKWSLALWHLGYCLEDQPENHEFRHRRAEALAETGRYQEAKADYLALLSGQNEFHKAFTRLAKIYLVLNATNDYLRLGTELLDRFGSTTNADIANRIAESCLVVPNTNSKRALHLAEESVVIEPNCGSLFTLGTAHFRAGHFAKALEQFHRGRALAGGDHYYDLLEGMTQFHLGNRQEARRLLDKAIRRIDAISSLSAAEAARDSLPWHQKFELQLLRREAEEMIGAASGAEPKNSSRR